MTETSTPGHSRRLTKAQKLSFAGIAGFGAAALVFSLVPANGAESSGTTTISAAPVAWTKAVNGAQTKTVQAHLGTQKAIADQKAINAATQAAVAKAKADADNKAKAAAQAKARAAKTAASRSATRTPVFANNLDGWIKEALHIMKREGIPGTYAGIHKNVMRESSGNPLAINNWDINAQNGIPSKGLLQVIAPTFKAYHVKGTKFDQYDPVANIVAACNYAADRYGSMDNVNSAY
ncbi:transglycosylase SLT domain-containing protein [Streptomyces sp. NPDC054949]